METRFTYNDVLVKDVVTDYWNFSSEKESTGVDQIGVVCELVFTGVVHQIVNDTLAGTHTGIQTADFAGDIASIVQKLSKDRRRFILQIGRSVILDIVPGAIEPGAPQSQAPTTFSKTDIGNGPTVSVQVIKIVGGISAHVRFTIRFLLANCGGVKGDNKFPGLLNFRFWIHEDIDCGTWLTTRTYVGRIRVAHKNINPHELAGIVTVPPLEKGFQRRIVQWHESSDGLHLDFTIQDRERIASAPWSKKGFGAVEWDGDVTAATGNNYGFTGTITIRVRLTGPKTTSKADLIRLAFLVGDSKARLIDATNAVQPGGKSSVFLQSLSVNESLADNNVELTAVVLHTGGNVIAGIISVGKDQLLGKPLTIPKLDYDPDLHFTPGSTAGVGGLFSSILQTPCSPASMPVSLYTPKKRRKKAKQVPAIYESPGDEGSLRSTDVDVSVSNITNVYVEYLLDSDYHLNTGRIALPTGASRVSKAPTIAVVSLHNPTAIRDIHIDATRLNATPELPDWHSGFTSRQGIVHTPIGEPMLSPTAPQVSADARKLLFRAQMRLHFAMDRPPNSGEPVPIGCVPYRTVAPADASRSMPSGNFVDPKLILL